MGPITLFDKSFLQSLSLDEAVFFDHFFMPIICPIFFVETLADLEKQVRKGRTPEQEVGIIADKVPEMSGGACSFHIGIAVANLLGHNVPLAAYIPIPGSKAVRVDGKSGIYQPESQEAEALRRWQNREFLVVERQFARSWRTALGSSDLAGIAETIRAIGVTPEKCKSFADAKALVNRVLNRGGSAAAQQINLASQILGVHSAHQAQALECWRFRGRPPLSDYAPYTAHVVSVELFFQVALGANLISATDANNKTDMAYLFYTPFCNVFVSGDRLHERCAPHFLRPDQSFVWGHDLKSDLYALMTKYSARPEDEKEMGLMKLAPTPPDDSDGLVARLWDRHFTPKWRNRTKPPIKQDDEKEMVDHINRVATAPEIPHTELDPYDPDFVCIQRRIARRRGNWWQVPKDAK